MSATIFLGGKFRAFSAPGVPLAGGLLYAYQAGTTTPQDTYTGQDAGTPNTNPVVLDANGEADVWMTGIYKFILKDSNGVQQWSEDNISDTIFSTAFSGTSTTSSIITTGAVTFVTQAGKAWATGQVLILASGADPTNYMLGQVTSYSGTTLVMDITANGGSGTHTDWNISLSGPIGPTGATGGGGGGSGNVTGPVSSHNGYFAIWDGTSGQLLKDGAGAPGTAAYLNVGTGANQIVQLDGSGNLPAVPLQTPGYAPANQTITASSVLTLAHGLGAAPKLVRVGIICISASDGYSINDIIWDKDSYSVQDDSGGPLLNYGYTVSSNTVNIYIAQSSRIGIISRTTKSTVSVTLANWKYIIKVWK